MQLSFPVCQMMTCKLHFSPEPVSFYSKENSSLSCWDFNTQLSDVEAETWDPPPWRICELCNYEVGRLEGSSVFPVDSYFFCLLFEVYLESNIIPPSLHSEPTSGILTCWVMDYIWLTNIQHGILVKGQYTCKTQHIQSPNIVLLCYMLHWKGKRNHSFVILSLFPQSSQ